MWSGPALLSRGACGLGTRNNLRRMGILLLLLLLLLYNYYNYYNYYNHYYYYYYYNYYHYYYYTVDSCSAPHTPDRRSKHP